MVRSTVRTGACALVLVSMMFVAACAPRRPAAPNLDAIAERYVRLALALGRHDADYVDSYYGPAAWKEEAARDSLSLTEIIRRADSLATALGNPAAAAGDDLVALRHRYVRRQLLALAARARMLAGEKFTFDHESRMLYDAVAPERSDSSFAPALATLDSLLPGKGVLADRLEAYRQHFVIPPPKVDTVFRAAIAEARRRTRAHLALPDSESFTVEYVKGQPWSGYNWYQGGLRSLIQVNIDLPIYIDRAIDLACHEGYPGHHVYNVLLEQALVRERGWQEFTMFPLFSPLGLIAEGTAVVADDIAFPGDSRVAFEKRVLFPLARLDTTEYERYARIRHATEALSMAGVEGARRYLEGAMSREAAAQWLIRYALLTPARADKSLRFDERYRSYVVNYRLGREIVLHWLDANGGDESHPQRRWQLYQTLLASPRLPADLLPRQ